MTQKEYDAQMMEINEQQAKATLPVKREIGAINSKMLEIRHQMDEMRAQLSKLSMEKHSLEVRLKEINADYHERKHWLVLEAPAKQKCPLM